MSKRKAGAVVHGSKPSLGSGCSHGGGGAIAQHRQQGWQSSSSSGSSLKSHTRRCSTSLPDKRPSLSMSGAAIAAAAAVAAAAAGQPTSQSHPPNQIGASKKNGPTARSIPRVERSKIVKAQLLYANSKASSVRRLPTHGPGQSAVSRVQSASANTPRSIQNIPAPGPAPPDPSAASPAPAAAAAAAAAARPAAISYAVATKPTKPTAIGVGERSTTASTSMGNLTARLAGVRSLGGMTPRLADVGPHGHKSPDRLARVSQDVGVLEATRHLIVPILYGQKIIGPDAIRLRLPLSTSSTEAIQSAFAGLSGAWGSEGDVRNIKEPEKNGNASDVSFLYGEVLPAGVRKLLDSSHADALHAESLVDLGCGKGRLALQAFFEFPNLKLVVAIEYSRARFECAQAMLRILALSNPRLLTYKAHQHSACLSFGPRTFELRHQDLFEYQKISEADIVVCETDIPKVKLPNLVTLFSGLKANARLILYHRLSNMPGITSTAEHTVSIPAAAAHKPATFTEITDDVYSTSWNSAWRFDLWKRQ